MFSSHTTNKLLDWFQGQPLGRRFKAIVCHDGIFSTLNAWSTEELFFIEHEFAGTLWEKRENYEKWDPARFTHNWETPMLVSHDTNFDPIGHHAK